MKVKVCGLREPENIRDVEALGVDMVGFIFWKDSPRYVSMISANAGIIPDYAWDLTPRTSHLAPRTSHLAPRSSHLAPRTSHLAQKVGVFVDDMPQNIVTRVYNYKLDWIQLHGSESPVMIDNLKRTLIPDIKPDIKIIKAISVNSREDVEKWRQYQGHVDMLLFDTKCKTVGGSGEHFDWSVLNSYDGDIPFLLSGGIGPDDAERVKAFHHPQFAGIDLNSRFETSPGVKDINLLKEFLKKVL